ncbi:MAG TPA: V-type ATPase subunit [Thermoplasmata archaeon]|nr:V-type ATPase subunit [Thermoplasmata archaeon]
MSSSPYASPLGRIKAQLPSFLPKEIYGALSNAPDVGEIAKLLEPTPYGPYLGQAAATYRGADLIEVAVNRYFVQRNRMGLEVAPFAGRAIVQAYLRRWDIQNVGAILAAKVQGRTVSEEETFLVSPRELPAGLLAGPMVLDDFRLLMQAPTVEAVVQGLVRFGYGAVLLPLVEEFQRSKDIFPLLSALDRYYYAHLLEATKFFQGDEWTVRRFIQTEIDLRNLLLLLKGRDASFPPEVVFARFLDGGEMGRAAAQDLYSAARDVPALVQALESRAPRLADGLGRYSSDRSLVGFEAALARQRAIDQLKQLRSYPLSLAVIFAFLLLAELERNDLQRVVFAKAYGVPREQFEPLLISPSL